MLEGTKPYETVYLNKNKLEIQTRIDSKDKDNYTMTTLAEAIANVVKSDLGKELINKIKSGIRQFPAFGCEFVEISYSREMKSTVKQLGKIDSPPNDAPSGGSWLFAGFSASKNAGESRWKMQKTWKAADNGAVWDKELYGS